MKHLILTQFYLISSILLYSQTYSDWKDLDLKMKPKHIIEASMFSPVELSDTIFKDLFQLPLNLLVSRSEKYFDINGLLTKEYNKEYYDSTGIWSDLSDMKRHIYNDSVIIEHYLIDGFKYRTEKYFLNKDGYPILKHRYPYLDTTMIFRNENNEITKEYIASFGIDTWVRKVREFDLNEYGDILKETSHILDGYPVDLGFENIIYMDEYQYIYDTKGNWIINIHIEKNEVKSITERKIEYY